MLTRQEMNRKKGNGIYYEMHHIKPKSLGGTNDSNNLVLLTAREHFIAHLLLLEIYRGTESYYSMLRAMWFMINGSKKERLNVVSARQYSRLRTEFGIKPFSKLHLEKLKASVNTPKYKAFSREKALKMRAEGKFGRKPTKFFEYEGKLLSPSDIFTILSTQGKMKVSKTVFGIRLLQGWDIVRASETIIDQHPKNQEESTKNSLLIDEEFYEISGS